VHGAQAALAAVIEVDAKSMRNHPVYHAVRAGLLARSGTTGEAKAEYDLAIAAQDNPVERDWLRARRGELR
jgi:RNA polymerase sigma-70 factor (ECF subfamily)